jgi:hypothetical protein
MCIRMVLCNSGLEKNGKYRQWRLVRFRLSTHSPLNVLRPARRLASNFEIFLWIHRHVDPFFLFAIVPKFVDGFRPIGLSCQIETEIDTMYH